LGLLWFYIKTEVFIPVTAQLAWLDNVSGVPRAHFSLLLIGQQGLGHFFQAPALDSHWLKDFADGTPTAERNDHPGNKSEGPSHSSMEKEPNPG
jgi:hypothetical protein